MKHLVITFLGLFFAVAHPSALAGNSSGGGAGFSEKNLVFAMQNLESYIDLCLASASCRIDATQTAWLKEIKTSLKEEGPAETQVIFRSEKEEPGFFLLDGAVRVAKTGGAVGDPIYVNRDLLYRTVNGIVAGMTLPQASALLIHELGHHHKHSDHVALDALGSKVESQIDQRSSVLDGGLWNQYVHLRVIYGPGFGLGETFSGFSQILITDSAGVHDLTRVVGDLKCYEGTEYARPLDGFALWNIHFEEYGTLKIVPGKDNESIADIMGGLTYRCGAEVVLNAQVRLSAHIQTDWKTDTYKLLSAKAEFPK